MKKLKSLSIIITANWVIIGLISLYGNSNETELDIITNRIGFYIAMLIASLWSIIWAVSKCLLDERKKDA